MAHSTPLRWGILGTAHINRALIPPIRASRNSQLLAVASRNASKASKYATSWKISRSYASYDALLSDPDIDVIYNSLPNGLHFEWSVKAMQAGKHILCEKPITTSAKEVAALKEISHNTGMIITEAFMYRHHPQTLMVRQMVQNGDIGKLQLIRGSFCYTGGNPTSPIFDPELGGGSLWDVGCYPINYARFITGTEPIEVFGHQIIGDTGVEVLYSGQILFPEDITLQFESSFITPFKSFMEITGEKGRILIPEPFKPGKKARICLEREHYRQSIPIKGQELYQGEVEDIENAILYCNPPRISLDDSKANVATIEALYQSAEAHKPVRL